MASGTIRSGVTPVSEGGTGRTSITEFMQEDLKINQFTIGAGTSRTIELPSGQLCVIFWMRAGTYGVAMTAYYNDNVYKVIDSGVDSPTIVNDTSSHTVTITNTRSSNVSFVAIGGILK